MLAFEKVCKRYKNFELRNINFKLDKGDFLCIVGKTGSGKSLILDLITGIKNPDSGKIFLNNADLSNVSIHKRDVSIVYQDSFLFPHLNVEDNIKYGLKYKKSKGFDFDYIVNFFNIKHLLKRKVSNLSGGEKQRVAIARAIIIKPKLLLLDEPLTAIDFQLKSEIMNLLKRVHEKLDLTTIMVTHFLDDLWQLPNKILLIEFGKQLQFGLTNELFYVPKNEKVARFVKMTNILKVKMKNNKVFFNNDSFDFESNLNGIYQIGVRPENISLTKEKTDDLISIKSKVDKIHTEGPFFSVYCRNIDYIFHSYLSKNEFLHANIQIGDEVYVNFSKKDVHIFKENNEEN